MTSEKTYTLHPIGKVCRDVDGIFINVDERYRPALQDLAHFSHVLVLAWADQFDTPEHRSRTTANPPHAPDRPTGIFATRSPVRPNPILLTPCRLLGVDQTAGRVMVENLDFYDGTPVLDLKAYYPVSDRVREAHIAPWLVDWPQWLPEEGLGLDDIPRV
ncbi:MAG: SAM-dependent methyltransferase [Anaerolineae bacterium]|nr:SAM-dependent methyltransferase [Anaerolineae bacterium]